MKNFDMQISENLAIIKSRFLTPCKYQQPATAPSWYCIIKINFNRTATGQRGGIFLFSSLLGKCRDTNFLLPIHQDAVL